MSKPYDAEIKRLEAQVKANPKDQALREELRDLRKIAREASK